MTGEFECSRAVATNRSTSSRSTGGEAAIYGSLWKSVRVYVWRWYCDWDLAEEIASDVVARLWERREKHHPNTLEWRFVVSCIRNAVRDHWKAETRERERRARADSPVSATPHDDYVEAECWRYVAQAIARLPEHVRVTFLAVDLEGVRIKKVAEERGVSRKMVEKDLTAARRAARAAIEGSDAQHVPVTRVGNP